MPHKNAPDGRGICGPGARSVKVLGYPNAMAFSGPRALAPAARGHYLKV